MLTRLTRNRLVGLWFAAVAVIMALIVATGMDVGAATRALLIALSLVPPGIIMALWRGDPPSTIGQLLYAQDPLVYAPDPRTKRRS